MEDAGGTGGENRENRRWVGEKMDMWDTRECSREDRGQGKGNKKDGEREQRGDEWYAGV